MLRMSRGRQILLVFRLSRPRQIIRDLKPGQLFLCVGVPLRSEILGMVEQADMKVDFVWPARAFVRDGRSAALAPGATDTIRSGELLRRTLKNHICRLNADIGRDRGTGRFPAIVAMAIADPKIIGCRSEGNAAARAATCESFGHGVLPP